MLRESLFDRLGDVVGSGAGGLQLDQEREHLFGQRVFDRRRLVRVVGAEDTTEPLGLGRDAPLATGPLERGLQLRTGVSGPWMPAKSSPRRTAEDRSATL